MTIKKHVSIQPQKSARMCIKHTGLPTALLQLQSLCREFQEYDRQRMAGYAARDRERENEWSLAPFNSPSYKRYGRTIKEREV